MFSPAAMIYPQAQVLQIAPDRIHVSKVVWALSDDEGRIAHQARVYPNIRRVGQIVAVVENEAAPKALRSLTLT